MIAALLCAMGLPAGMLMLWRVPRLKQGDASGAPPLSIVIPARNEEASLPRLLTSLQTSGLRPLEIIVVDDGSTDSTAALAAQLRATVLASALLPPGWTGKAWACHQGAQQARGDLLLFLDADTFFLPGGLDRMVARWLREGDARAVLSVLPYHATEQPYEQLSLIFNLMMAAGAGGFGLVAPAQLFGQSMLLAKPTYLAAGGHEAVRGQVLENLYLAQRLRAIGAPLVCVGGRGSLHIRMFPEGPQQMTASWTKAFVHGATASSSAILASSIVWISALWATALLLPLVPAATRPGLAAVYLLLALQLAWMSRQLGRYAVLTALLYPLPLLYYCIVFARSAARRARGRRTLWRGRPV